MGRAYSMDLREGVVERGQLENHDFPGRSAIASTAPWFTDEPINGENLPTLHEKVLVPTLPTRRTS
jgi:hypothetical protein